MKILRARVMNEPGEEVINQLNKRLAEILLKDLGKEKCRLILDENNKKKATA